MCYYFVQMFWYETESFLIWRLFFFSTKAEILKYTRLRIEMLRFVKFYKLLYASRNRLYYFRNIVHKSCKYGYENTPM